MWWGAAGPTYVSFFEFVDGVDAVVEDALARVTLVANEADEDVGVRAAPAHRARAHRHAVFDHWGDTKIGETTPETLLIAV